MNASPAFSIGIVTYNSSKLLNECLTKIQEALGNELAITIFDNNSTDTTKSIIKSQFPEIKLIESKKNLGFGYGVNQLMMDSNTQYVLLLNPDVKLSKGSVQPLIDDMEDNPEIIVSAPTTFDLDGNPEFNVRRFPNIRTQLFESLFGGTIAKHFSQSELVSNINNYPDLKDIDWIKGAIWMVRRDAFQQLGGMRSDFFLYSEETEFAWRAKLAGYKFSIAKGSIVTHTGGDSDTNPLLFSLLTLNKLFMMKILNKRFGFQLMRVILMTGSLIRLHKPSSRLALSYLLKSYFNFENQRLNIIARLNGTFTDEK